MTTRAPTRRAGLVLAIAAVVAMAAVPEGDAITGDVIAADQGWYTSLSVDAGETIVDPVAANTIEDGELPVGAFGTTELKRSYLRLEMPAGTVAATITLAQSENQLNTFGAAGPIVACPLVGPWAVVSGVPMDQAPEIDCTTSAVGTLPELAEDVPDVTGDYTFDLAPILAWWQAGNDNNGIALVADVTEPQSLYQVTFGVPYFSVIGTATLGSPVPVPGPGSGGGGQGSVNTTPGGTQAGIAPTAPEPGSARPPAMPPIATAPVVVTQPTTTLQLPTVAPPEVAAEPATPEPVAVSAPALDPLPVNPGVWLMFPLFTGGLLATWRGLGRAGEPPSALDRALMITGAAVTDEPRSRIVEMAT